MRVATFALDACILLLVVGTAAAQDRMPPIPKDKMTEAQRKAFDEVTSGPRGAGGAEGPFVPLLRSPELMSRLQMTGEYLRFHNTIGSKLTEFVILLTARQWTQQYEYDVHQVNGLKAGVKQETISAITEGRRPAGMAADEEIVFDFCSELRQNQSVSDATYARAVSKFGEQGVIDMTGLVGYYTTLAMIMNVARSPLPDGKKAPLAPFPH
ncbi:MAG: 4-carboxy muconolactone decarboxylase [Acidobacteria bacterium]|nr:MAG: 4-carboxy muconolactone decarboxylase [Acidobacteriota bacterium]